MSGVIRDGAPELAELVQLTCSRCGKPVASLEIPHLSADDLNKLHKLYGAVASWGWMIDVKFPKLEKGVHPFRVVGPELLSKFAGVVHPECIAAAFQEQADGAA